MKTRGSKLDQGERKRRLTDLLDSLSLLTDQFGKAEQPKPVVKKK